MKKLVTLVMFLLQIVGGGNLVFAEETTVASWDFSTPLSDTDGTNLTADVTNWSYDSNNSRWDTTSSFSVSAGALKANNVELEWTKGLLFTASGQQKIRLKGGTCLYLNGSNLVISIPNLQAGDKVAITYNLGGGSDARGFSLTNLTVDGDESATQITTTSKTNANLTVKSAGTVSFTSTAGVQVYSIKVTRGESATPSNTLSAVQNYTWIFGQLGDVTASSTVSVLTHTDGTNTPNIELCNVSVANYGSGTTSVDGLGDITKDVYFSGGGSTSDKYVKVKVQGPCKITIWGKSSSSSNDRILKLNCGGTVTYVTAAGASISSGSYTYTGTAAQDVYIYSGGSGIYLFGIKVEPVTLTTPAYVRITPSNTEYTLVNYNDGSWAQVETGYTTNLSTMVKVTEDGEDISDKFTYSYSYTTENGSPSPIIGGNVLNAGNTEGNFYLTVTATPKAGVPYNECSTQIGFKVVDNTPVPTLTAVSDKVWNFSDWSEGKYSETQIVSGQNIEFITSNDLTIDGSKKTFIDADTEEANNLGTLSFTRRFKTGGTSSATTRLVHFKVTKGSTIQVVTASQGDNSRTLSLYVGSYDGTTAAATVATDGNLAKLKYTYNGDGDADIYLGTGGGMGIYYIKVSSNRTPVYLYPDNGTMNSTGSSANPAKISTEAQNNHFSYYVTYSPAEAVTAGSNDVITSGLFEVSSSNPSVVSTQNAWFKTTTWSNPQEYDGDARFAIGGLVPVSGGSAVLTLKYKGTETYAEEEVQFTVYVDGPIEYNLLTEDHTIQQGQRSSVNPVVTDRDGNPIKIVEESGTYTVELLDEEDDIPDYTQWFDFTYEAGAGTGTDYERITVDNDGLGTIHTRLNESNNVVEGNYASVGDTRSITVTAKPKTAYSSLFTNTSSVVSQTTVTIIDAPKEIKLDFWWKDNKTQQVTEPATKDDTTKDYKLDGNKGVFGQSGTFSGGFPNGRMLYVTTTDANADEEIWFSYAVNGDASDLSESNLSLNAAKGIYQYRRGIPIHEDEVKSGDYISVNVVPAKKNADGTYTISSAVARMKFYLKDYSRPAAPTYDPQSPSSDEAENYTSGGKTYRVMDTSLPVTSVSSIGGDLYGKFSTSSVYTTEQLLNEATVTSRLGDGSTKNSVGVTSTEVANRRFTTVQIRHDDDGDYVSKQSMAEYWYLYDTQVRLIPGGDKYINVKETSEKVGASAVWYNKGPYDYTNKKNQWASGVWQAATTQSITYSVESRNGASDATLNASTGAVTAGSETGYVVVKVSYTNSSNEAHGGTTGSGSNREPKREDEPQYEAKLADTYITYTVYISDPTAQEPIITPTSRKFYPTLTYKVQAPTEWDVYYTTDGTEPSATNGKLLKVGNSVEETIGDDMNIGDSKKVQAIAVNPNSTTQTSRVVEETYTKAEPISDPVFNPDGVPAPYYYNTSSLSVQITCNTAEAYIYYTTDGTNPVIGAENTHRYSGLEKVTIHGNVSIKAVAYKDGIFSNVVTSNYIYTTDMDMPYFQISNDNGSTWQGFGEKGDFVNDGAYWYGGEAHEVTTSTLIRIVNPNSGGNVYYTLDGSVPDDQNGTPYTAGSTFTVVKTTKGSAIVMIDEASSKVALAVFTITVAEGANNLWEAIESTTPGGKLDKGVRIISTDQELPTSNSQTAVNSNSISANKAVPGITATFGGFDNGEWKHTTIGEKSQGTPVEGVGDYSIRCNTDTKEELGNLYDHRSSTYPTTHAKTFGIPAQGAFVRFEPEYDGELSIYVLQQGALHYTSGDDTKWCDKFIRRRPVYMVDEQGKSLKIDEAKTVSTARLSENWKSWLELAANKYPDFLEKGKKQYTETNNLYTILQSDSLFDFYRSAINAKGWKAGDPIKPIPIHTEAGAAGNVLSLGVGDQTGYVMPSGGYVKYVFHVQAGKSYYFFGQLTKLGIRGFGFKKADTDNMESQRTALTIDETSTTNYVSDNKDKVLNVTLQRAFKKDTWAGLVLPFSVSVTQIEKVFGKGTDVVHFDAITGAKLNNIHLKRHWYKMVVAGTPVLIRPTQDLSSVKFEGVRIEADVVDVIDGGTYDMVGNFVQTSAADGTNPNFCVRKNDYYITTGGDFKQMTAASATTKATRAWLRPDNPTNNTKLAMAFFDDDDDNGGVATPIIGVAESDAQAPTGAYNLRGQKVSSDIVNLSSLPKGVYIVNGKKVVIE